MSAHEVGRFAYSAPHRTAIVMDVEKFQHNRRSAKMLRGLIDELKYEFGGGPPYFATLAEAEE